MNDIDFIFKDGNKGYKMSAETVSANGGIILTEINIDFGEDTIPEKVRLDFRIDITDIKATWSPSKAAHELYANWYKDEQCSRAASGAPIKSFIGYNDYNVCTIALSDCKTPLVIRSGVNEEDAVIDCTVEFFTETISPIKSYKTLLRLDFRHVPYYKSIHDSQFWWHKDCGFKNAYIPETARLPMYSTWYSFHQQLSPSELISECKHAANLGMKAVIIDDGWQTKDNSRGYAYCGDWEPEPGKVGDMAKLVSDIHKLGMKVILWYSVPFVGKYSKAWKQFEGKFLDDTNREWNCLDPRFPEVREYLTEIYKKAALDWKLDGFKLDFIDSFILTPETANAKPGHDITSLEDAIERLLNDITTALKEINPNICIEFRQSYMGPLMLSYGNMIRVGDCPGDALKNRVEIASLRLTSGKCPVHSDMMMWNYKDTPEGAARQLINSFFAVPQISVKLARAPKEHIDMLRFYLDFWSKNHRLILDGEFIPLYPDQKYALIISRGESSEIAVNYSTGIYKIERHRATLINCGNSETVYIDTKKIDGYGTVDIYDCMGTHIDHVSSYLEGVIKFNVPICGMVVIKKH